MGQKLFSYCTIILLCIPLLPLVTPSPSSYNPQANYNYPWPIPSPPSGYSNYPGSNPSPPSGSSNYPWPIPSPPSGYSYYPGSNPSPPLGSSNYPWPNPSPPSGYSNGDSYYYRNSCPHLDMIVWSGIWQAYKNETRIAASLLRLHFHDCIVNGCDASILLDDTDDFIGEKNAPPNRNSARGYEVIDAIKAEVEKACPSTVSCVDILTLAARAAVVVSGGPSWSVSLGRRDGLTASQQAANDQLPSPIESLEKITAKFTSKGLDIKDVVALSGAHTIGFAQCFTFKRRLFNFKGSGKPDPDLDSSAVASLQSICPNKAASNTALASLDTSVSRFDNVYFGNIVNNTGLLESDQALMNDATTAPLVNAYSNNPNLFSTDFAASMVKLGNLGILTGTNGQIRKKCGSVN